MKLSESDREHIEVLEELGVDEYTLCMLLARYFEYRGARYYAPDKALEHTIRQSMIGQHDRAMEIFKTRIEPRYRNLYKRLAEEKW